MLQRIPLLLLPLLIVGCAMPPTDGESSTSVSSASSEAASEMSSVSEGYALQEVVSGLQVPWSIAFTSPERMLVTERSGSLRVVENGVLRSEPLHVFTGVSSQSEEGLMGLAVDPDYARNRRLYLCVAVKDGTGIKDRVLRFTDEGDRLANETILLDDIPAAQYHAGCRLQFGPDGKLYVTAGDATSRQLAQDLTSLAGKILRLSTDGSIPDDNPFPNSPVWSYGHRNSQGIAWHPDSGVMYETEHGPSGFDGSGGGDEVNRIVPGGNYGWPLVSHDRMREGTVMPIRVFTPAEAPASILIYSGDLFPQWRGNLFFGALRGEGLWRLVIDPVNPDRVLQAEKLADIRVGRVREVAQGPDGVIYITTSNTDGRGQARQGDDRVMKIVPR